MNRYCLFLLAAIITSVLCANAMAVTHQYTGLWGQPGINVVSSTKGGVEITYSMDKVDITDIDVNGESMQAVDIGALTLPNQAGAPDVPTLSRYLAAPEGAAVRAEIIGIETETIKGVEMAPAPVIPSEKEDGLVYRRDAAVYGKDAFYPDDVVMVSGRKSMRGVPVRIFSISPVQYNPVTRELKIHRNMRVRFSFEGGNGRFGEDRLRSRWWDPILASALLNYEQLPVIDYAARNVSKAQGYEYVIITPTDATARAWADTIRQWRTLQGIKTGVFTTDSTGTAAAQIESWINNAYNNWAVPPVAILLIGDRPGQGSYTIDARTAGPHPYSGTYYPCDNIYADVDNDSLPEINVARLTGNTPARLATMVNKFLSYERTPYTSAGFYNNPLVACGWQTERWFQLCTEVVRGFFDNSLGKSSAHVYKIYTTPNPSVGGVWSSATNTSTVVNYFNNLGYIPTTNPYDATYWNAGTAQQINDAINSGAFIVQHRDHGGNSGWGEPAYSQLNAWALTNTMYPFLFTINCLTGAYQQTGSGYDSVCLGEAFHRQNYGVMGFIGPSEVSYSFVNDAFTWGMYDCLWPQFDPGYGNAGHYGDRNLMPGFAQVYGKWYLQASSWPYNTESKMITYNLFHMHGDAFTTLYTQMPQDLTVSHPGVLTAGVTTFPVTANQGAFIALTVNGEIIGTGTAPAKGTVNITIPGQTPGNTMVVTATMGNYRRYSANVPISAAAGPYVIHLKHAMSDASGNGDGVANPGETVRLPTWVVNYGVTGASGVVATLRTGSPNGTVTDSSYTFGTIAAGDSAHYGLGFGVLVNPADTNGMTIPLELECRDAADSVWTSSFSLTVGTGVLAFNARGIGGNGRLDPNEAAKLGVSLKNNGIGYSYITQAVLRCGSPLVTVTDSMAGYGTVNPGAVGTSGSDSFAVAVGSMPPGTSVGFTLVMKTDGVSDRLYSWNETVGDMRYSPTPDNSAGSPLYYAVEDSDGVGRAPVYQWTEIRGVGTALSALLADDATTGITLPFPFKWYGTSYTTLSACSNGWISFGTNTSTAYSNTAIPTSTFATPTVFPLWDDQNGLASSAPGAWVGYYHDAANGRLIVEYDSLVFYGTTTRVKYQVIYYDSTVTHPYYDVVVQYNMLSDRSSASVGFQQNSTVGCQQLYNGTYATTMVSPLKSGRAVRLTRSPEPLGVAVRPEEARGVPTAYQLGQAYPNPARGGATIAYQLPRADRVELGVYNIAGQKVRTLASGAKPAGYHTARWDGRDEAGRRVSAGVYLYRLTTPAYSRTGKLSLVK